MADGTTLSLTQKAALSSGANFWFTKAVGDIPAIMLTDGPHGLRKQVGDADRLDVAESIPATCFPPAAGLAQSWNESLVRRIGEALGRECRAEGVAVSGPASTCAGRCCAAATSSTSPRIRC